MDEFPVIDEAAVIPAEEYRELLASVGWRAVDASDGTLEAALAQTWTLVARARDDGRLVGLARVLDDGLIYASIWDVIVAPEVQRRGVARSLMERAMARLGQRRLVGLVATPAGDALYRSLGFGETSNGSRALFLRPALPAAPSADIPPSADPAQEKRPFG